MQATTMRSQQSVRWWCIIDLGFIHLSCQAFYHQTLTQIWFQNHGWFMICLGIIHPIYPVYWGLSCMDFLAVFGFGGGFSSSSGRHLSVLRHSDLLLSLPLLCPLPLPLLWWLALKISKAFLRCSCLMMMMMMMMIMAFLLLPFLRLPPEFLPMLLLLLHRMFLCLPYSGLMNGWKEPFP